ncbi:LEA type 2 family protein [bacterium]|nr:LEA type 2 family protein [bacterium]
MKMNKLIALFILITLSSCTLTQEPDFVKLDDYKIITLNKNEIKLSADSYFLNPNDVGCEVVKTDIELLVNGLYVSKVNQPNSISLSAGKEFTVPLIVSVPTSSIIKDKKGILGGVLSGLFKKKY